MRYGMRNDDKRLVIPETPLEIAMVNKVLNSLVTDNTPLGEDIDMRLYVGSAMWTHEHTVEQDVVPDDEDPGWFRLEASAHKLPRKQAWKIPMIGGKIALLERQHPCNLHYVLDVAWQFKGKEEYWGGDGPVSQASMIFACDFNAREAISATHPT